MQVQPTTVLIETNVVCAGKVSSIVTVAAAPGPLFVTVSVYVMLLPPSTVLGVPVFVTARSAWVEEEATTVVTVAKLFVGLGSVVAAETVAVSVIDVPPVTVTTTVNVVDAPDAKAPIVQEIDVFGHVQPDVPEVAVAETNVVFAGSASVNATVLAGPGPLLVTTTV